MKLARQIIDPLESAAAAWRSGRRADAIELLLDAWRACRDPQLAELIERLAPLPREPWPTSDADCRSVVDPLLALPDDPRVASRLASFLELAFAQRAEALALFDRVCRRISSHDPWSVRLVRTVQPGPFTRVIVNGGGPVAGLVAKLGRIPRSWPDEIEVDARPDRTAAIDTQLAAFPNATIRAPWR